MSDHHDHPLPPPEPDHIEAGGITFWGLISFAAVIASVFGLSGYFWLARQSADEFLNTTYSESKYKKAMAAESAEKLSGIKDAMQSITDDKGNNARAMHWTLPKAVATPMTAPLSAGITVEASKAPKAFAVNAKLAAKGKGLFTSKNCAVCHSIDGTRKIGPTMKGIWGRKEKMADGTVLHVDRAYFVKSIKEPMSQIVEGYPPGMAQLPVSDDEIEAILNYVVSIK